MSIIIRLQNLPWSARSGDIRHFFGGLRIPDGGVHIIGGEKGDAFIAFNSDEDARLAMRKDGGKIKDTRVKLLLSSHMEMQHVIERVTKQPFQTTSSPRSLSKERPQESRSRKDRSPESKPSRGRSPVRRRRDFSPRSSHHSREDSRLLERGRKRSRSPVKKSVSPHVAKRDDMVLSTYASDLLKTPRNVRAIPPPNEQLFIQQAWGSELGPGIQNDTYKSLNTQDGRFSREELQHSVEDIKRILTPNLSDNRFPENASFNSSIPFLRDETPVSQQRERNYNAGSLTIENPLFPSRVIHDESSLSDHRVQLPERPDFQYDMKSSDRGRFLENEFQPNNFRSFEKQERFDDFRDGQETFHPDSFQPHTIPGFDQPLRRPDLSDLAVPPPPPFHFAASPEERNQVQLDRMQIPERYCVRMLGLNPRALKKDVQATLKGVYAPHNKIKWELDDLNQRTGVAIVMLNNIEDFMNVLDRNPYFLDNNQIEIFECPPHIAVKYFPLEEEINFDASRQYHKGFCYMLKGLPFSVTYDDVINFFRDINIRDAFIIYEKPGKATGTGYIEFYNERDFCSAMKMNGKKIAHRYIEILLCSKSDIEKAKKKYGDENQPPSSFKSGPSFSNDQLHQQLKRRPLCAQLTGLPPTIHYSQIYDFFEEVGIRPFAIHLMLNGQRQPNGKCFAEFPNPLDFDNALKCHGNHIGNNMICVKQVLHDEMVKILDSQEASHHFESEKFGGSSSKSDSNLPEKVPYLWEPPDANECDSIDDQDIFTCDNFKRTSKKERTVDDRRIGERNEFSNSGFSRQDTPKFPQSSFNEKYDRFHEQKRFMSDDLRHNRERTMLENERGHADRMSNIPSGQYSNPMEEDAWNFRSGNNDNGGDQLRNVPPVNRDFDRPNVSDYRLRNRDEGIDYQNLDFVRKNVDDFGSDRRGDNFNRNNFPPTENRNNPRYDEREKDLNQFNFPLQHPDMERDRIDFQTDKRLVKEMDFPPPFSNIERDNRDSFRFDRREMDSNLPASLPPWKQNAKYEIDVPDFKPDKNDDVRKRSGGATTTQTKFVSEENNRAPVKFEVKMKLPAADKAVDEVFRSENESKKKLSRLSPEKNKEIKKEFVDIKVEKEVKSSKFTNSPEGRQSGKSHKSDSKSKSSKNHSPNREKDGLKSSSVPEKKVDRTAESDRSKDKTSQSSKENGRSSYDQRSRGDDRRSKTENYRPRSRSSHRNDPPHPSNSSRELAKDERKESASGNTSCTVQLINVHPDIGLEEILDFFHNFDLRKDKVIRRYTDRGEPTGDVRVCFKSSRDAERAMKLLNRHYLGGIPVEMFLV